MTSIWKAANRSAWPLKFLPKPLECCHVAHSAGHPPPDETAERELQSEVEGYEEGHASTIAAAARVISGTGL
ncbi:MAG: hypothetical protein H2050_07100 [Sphingobium sp.]|uniref:hypothetical protein n=1 Tax=Sphingobium sp. TaxID=1912891 RepID=UPI0018545823|nr:hypothetical protein [Sphingobium sp.]MBA4754580.1 hypothetical protein [Sphingobium sp.]